jgi:hypothetical protein
MTSTKTCRVLRAPIAAAALAAASIVPGTAGAAENVTYTYDARGRLVEVERVRPGETVKVKYTYDLADNRTKKEITKTP